MMLNIRIGLAVVDWLAGLGCSTMLTICVDLFVINPSTHLVVIDILFVGCDILGLFDSDYVYPSSCNICWSSS